MAKKNFLSPDLKNYYGETFEKAKPTGTTDENGFLLEKEAFHNVENMLYDKKKLTSKKDWNKLSEGMKNYFRKQYPKVTL